MDVDARDRDLRLRRLRFCHGADQSRLQFIQIAECDQSGDTDRQIGFFTDPLYCGRHGGRDFTVEKYADCIPQLFAIGDRDDSDTFILRFVSSSDGRTFGGRMPMDFRHSEAGTRVQIILSVLYHIRTARSRGNRCKKHLEKWFVL